MGDKDIRYRKTRIVFGIPLTCNHILLLVTFSFIVFALFQFLYFKRITELKQKYEFPDRRVHREIRSEPEQKLAPTFPTSDLWYEGVKLIQQTKTGNKVMSQDCKSLSDWDRVCSFKIY